MNENLANVINEASKNPSFLKGFLSGIIGCFLLFGGLMVFLLKDLNFKEILPCFIEPEQNKKEIEKLTIQLKDEQQNNKRLLDEKNHLENKKRNDEKNRIIYNKL